MGCEPRAEPAKVEVFAECHGADGIGRERTPIIAGIPASHVAAALYAYKDGLRRCVEEPRMCALAAELSVAEIEELAEHYGAMRRQPSGEDFDLIKAHNGGQIHEARCSDCRVFPEDENVDSALGIPLHAQRADYLRFALDAYRNGYRDTLLPAMEKEIAALGAEEIEALIHYYVSYWR